MTTLSPATQAELDRLRTYLEGLDIYTLAHIAHTKIPDKNELSEWGVQITMARGVLRRRTGYVVKVVE